MKDYREILIEMLRDKRLERPSIEQAIKPVYQVVGEIIDDFGMVFVKDVARFLYYNKLIEGYWTEIGAKLVKYSGSVGSSYGINVTTLEEAIAKVHERDYYKLNYSGNKRPKWMISKKNNILFKSEDKLVDLVNNCTKRHKVVIIECDFPRLDFKETFNR